jgi:MFS family permease
MIASDLVRAVLLLGVVATTELWQVFVLSFLVGLASQFFMPARATAVPEIVGREHYLSAVALTQMTFQPMQLSGPVIGGAIVGFLGTRAAFIVNAVTFAVSAGLISLVKFPPLPKKEGAVTFSAFRADLREGLAFLARAKVLGFIVSVFAIMILGFGFFDVLYIDYTRNVLGVSAGQFGLLQACSRPAPSAAYCSSDRSARSSQRESPSSAASRSWG